MAEAEEKLEPRLVGAYRRIQTTLGVSAVVVAAVLKARYGTQAALGLLFGAAVAFVNFTWLKNSMLALTERFIQPQAPPTPKSAALMVKFVLRYAVIGISAFVILKSSAASAYGFLFGLLMSVPALLFETVYELVYALRHDE